MLRYVCFHRCCGQVTKRKIIWTFRSEYEYEIEYESCVQILFTCGKICHANVVPRGSFSTDQQQREVTVLGIKVIGLKLESRTRAQSSTRSQIWRSLLCMLTKTQFLKSRIKLQPGRSLSRVSSVVLKITFGDTDWRFDNLSGSHLQGQMDCVLSVDGI